MTETEWETVAKTITDENGKYIFAGLPSGYYRTAFEVGAPWTVTSFDAGDTAKDSDASRHYKKYYNSEAFYMNPGQSDMTWDAGIFKSSEKKRDTIIKKVIKRVTTGGKKFVTGVKTGDTTSLSILFGTMFLAGGVVIVVINKKKRRNQKSVGN